MHRTTKMLLSIIAWGLAYILAFGTAHAGITGKISGAVTDSDGVPLPGAAITVEGTRLGATSDTDGHYIILQIPPGAYSVTAQLIGYTPMTITNARVNADLTTHASFRLFEATIEMDVVTVTAERPPIEVDVTGSQTIVAAERVSEMPVSQMLDVLDYQPGVEVVRDNELEIRGGGPSEIRFQVDGIDRTDGVTGKGYTQLNQMLVSEMTLLTGGFNAEYGNVRSGMVNVVVKEGSERGALKPWFAGVASYAPAQRKHFGPGAYDVDQYAYRLATLDTAGEMTRGLPGGTILWPDLYEQTSTDAAFMSQVDERPAGFGVTWAGWSKAVSTENSRRLRNGPAYGHNGWTISDMYEAWTWEANMNEQVWEYAHEPDVQMDLAMGLGLPKKLGGIVLGYSYNKEMTAVPALRPYYRDQSFESKLTLNPADNLKLAFGYMTAANASTGASAREGGILESPEASETNGDPGAGASDPVALRATSDLVAAVNGSDGVNSRTNLSFSSLLDGSFDQYSASLTYTVDANTYVTASFGRSESSWDLNRDLPRADLRTAQEGGSATNWTADAKWRVKSSWDYAAYLDVLYDYFASDLGGKPSSLDYATNPDNYHVRSPYAHPNAYDTPPTETKFITKTFEWGPRDWTAPGDDAPSVFDTTYHVTVVSPQGWVENSYSDLGTIFQLAGGGQSSMEASGVQTVLRGDITHLAGQHTLKSGVEYIGRDLEYTQYWSIGYYVPGAVTAGNNSSRRVYGGKYPAAQPTILGMYLQDKYESDGMIANIGVRVERFSAGQASWFYDDMFNSDFLSEANGQDLTRELIIAAGWDTAAWGTDVLESIAASFYTINDSLDGNAPMPYDALRAWPSKESAVHWRAAPRFGISHPVSHRTKFFFNYGVFYSMQKPMHLFGIQTAGGAPGAGGASMNQMFNPNLRPSRTSMYEVGVEHVLPLGATFKVTGYAKYNEDQVSSVSVQGGSSISYGTFRNLNYEDIRGYEIQFARTSGRFLNGAITYEASSSRTGEVAYRKISNSRATYYAPFLPDVRSTPARGFLRIFVRIGTPRDWGNMAGGWSLGTEYSWQKGGESLYNPNLLPTREIPDENYLPWTDVSNVNMKLAKDLALPGGRRMSAYLDVTNVLNTKHLNESGVESWQDYLAYIYTRRQLGSDIKVGDESTFYVLNEPYKIDPTSVLWSKPISPSTDWIQFLSPRFYRFGLRFEL